MALLGLEYLVVATELFLSVECFDYDANKQVQEEQLNDEEKDQGVDRAKVLLVVKLRF